MASNKQIKTIRNIAKKWGCSVKVYSYDTYREAIIYRGWYNECELPLTLMLREVQEWLDTHPVSYRFVPEYCDGKFYRVSVIIE